MACRAARDPLPSVRRNLLQGTEVQPLVPRTRRDGDPRELQQPRRVLPPVHRRQRVCADDEPKLVGRRLGAQRFKRVHGIGVAWAVELQRAHVEALIRGNRQLDHSQPVLLRRQGSVALHPRLPRREEPDAVEVELPVGLVREHEVRRMHRVERPAEEPSPCRHSAPTPTAAPLHRSSRYHRLAPPASRAPRARRAGPAPRGAGAAHASSSRPPSA